MKRLKLMKLQKQTQFNVKLDFPSCLELIPLWRKATTLVRFFRGFYLLIIELRTTQAKVTWHFSKWNLVLCYINNILYIKFINFLIYYFYLNLIDAAFLHKSNLPESYNVSNDEACPSPEDDSFSSPIGHRQDSDEKLQLFHQLMLPSHDLSHAYQNYFIIKIINIVNL